RDLVDGIGDIGQRLEAFILALVALAGSAPRRDSIGESLGGSRRPRVSGEGEAEPVSTGVLVGDDLSVGEEHLAIGVVDVTDRTHRPRIMKLLITTSGLVHSRPLGDRVQGRSRMLAGDNAVPELGTGGHRVQSLTGAIL